MSIPQIILCLGILAVIYWMYIQNVKKNKRIAALKGAYEQALRQGDKRVALEAGRKYYSALRDGKLTIYDEQALANDISTM